jgi:hypothetical protein
MSTEQREPASEALITELRSLRPIAPAVSSEVFWYEAGRASARGSLRGHRLWPISTAAMTLVASGLTLVLWLRNNDSTPSIIGPSTVPPLAQESQRRAEAHTGFPSPTSQWRLRRHLIERGTLGELVGPVESHQSTSGTATLSQWRASLLGS